MKRVTAIIETGADRRYSVYIGGNSYPYGIIGTGATVQEALEDFMEGYEEMKEAIQSTGKDFTEVSFVFRYDIPSFLEHYAFAFTLAGLERITGINQKQLGHYISGYRKPSAKTIKKMEDGLHSFCEQLSAVRFS